MNRVEHRFARALNLSVGLSVFCRQFFRMPFRGFMRGFSFVTLYCLACPSSDSRVALGSDQEKLNTPHESLDLDKAMELAESRAFSSRIATLNTKGAAEKYAQARAQVLPRFDVDAQKIWFSDEVNPLTGVSPFSPKNVTTAGITVAQPIIGLGPLLLQVRAASLQAEVAGYEEKTSQRDARLMGADAFLRTQKAVQFVSIAQKSLEVVEGQLKDSQALVRVGRLNRADAMRFELAHADAVQQLAQAKLTYEIARASLAEILGSPGASFSVSEPTTSLVENQKPQIPSVAVALKRALEKRTESKSADVNIEIAQYYRLASDLDYLPSLNAFVRYERDFEAVDTLYPPAPSPGSKAYSKSDIQDKFSYGLQLKWNIWDWGSRWARSHEYQANISKAQIGKEAAESQVRLEVTQSVLSLQSSIEGLETALSSVRLAEEVFKLTKARFESGQATSSDVIVSERDQTRARGGLVNIRGDLDLALLKLQRAMGEQPSTDVKNIHGNEEN